jgi:hypothetical protein
MKQLRSLSNDGVGCETAEEERTKYRPAVYQMLDGAVKVLLEAYDELFLSVEEHRVKVSIVGN